MVYLCKIYRQKRTVMKKFGMVIAIGREVKGVLEAFGKVEKIQNKPYAVPRPLLPTITTLPLRMPIQKASGLAMNFSRGIL